MRYQSDVALRLRCLLLLLKHFDAFVLQFFAFRLHLEQISEPVARVVECLGEPVLLQLDFLVGVFLQFVEAFGHLFEFFAAARQLDCTQNDVWSVIFLNI